MDEKMNADKLADALRIFVEAHASTCKYCATSNRESWCTRFRVAMAALAEHNAQPAQAAQPVGVPDGFLQHVAGVCGGVLAFCEPKPQKAYDDPTEYNGGQALEALAETERDIRAMLAAAPRSPAQPSADAEDMWRLIWMLLKSVDGQIRVRMSTLASFNKRTASIERIDDPDGSVVWRAYDAARAAEGVE